MNDLIVLRRALTAGRAAGFTLTRQHNYHTPDAGILRWRANRPGVGTVIIENWTPRRIPTQRWYARVAVPGLIVEFTENVTAQKAVDACVLAGILPADMASTYAAGAVDHARQVGQ